MSGKTAIILATMGGPDSLKNVKPFLTELFSDADVMMMPALLRKFLSFVIPLVRTSHAQKLYARFGGKSPLLENTTAQVKALQNRLGDSFSCFVVYRYGPVRAKDVAEQVKAGGFDRIVVLPLYPHYAHSTVRSSVKDWQQAAQQAGLDCPTTTVLDYADYPYLVEYWAREITALLEKCDEKPVLLFSAHGLPKNHVSKHGDIYPKRIKATVDAVLGHLPRNRYDSVTICYQSRVGPAEWLQPYLDNALQDTAPKPVVVIPVSFVCEHLETLQELDVDYKNIALEKGIKTYLRTLAAGVDAGFIDGLAEIAVTAARTEGYCFFKDRKLVGLQGLDDIKAINS